MDAAAPPEWEQISEEPRVEWHDHRIHWMSPTAPPQVRDDPESAHRILDWNVPLEAGGGAVVVSGTLDYSPPDEAGFSLFLLVPPVALVLAGGVLWLARGRGRGGDEAASGAPLGAHAGPRDDGVR